MNEPRQNDGQIQTLVFVLLLVVTLAALVVGGSMGSSPTTTADKATVEAPTTAVEPTEAPTEEAAAEPTLAPAAEVTTEATTEVTAEATAEALGAGVAEVTPEATEAPLIALGDALGQVVAEATAEATADASAAPVQRVYFASPADGATVPTTFTVEMGAEGLTVEPAGEIHSGAGHFHILIDTPFIAAGEVIPKDDTHLHFGQAQSSAELTLTPGDHVLRLQFADGAHTALEGDQYRAEITVHVE